MNPCTKRLMRASLPLAALLFGLGNTLSCSSPASGITGSLEGFPDDTLLVTSCPVSRLSDRQAARTDTIVSTNGRFNWENPYEEAISVTLKPYVAGTRITGGIRWDGRAMLQCFIAPGEQIRIRMESAEERPVYALSGSRLCKGISEFLAYTASANRKVTETQHRLQESYQLQESHQDHIEAYRSAYRDYQDAVRAYFLSHTDRPEAAYIITQAALDSTESWAGRLTPEVRNGILKPLLDDRLALVKEQRLKKQAREQVKVGKPAPDFTLRDLDGNPVSLSGLCGRYVILDFWGSWCHWCLKGIPDLKAAQAKYGDKLVILGIDCLDTEEKWKKAVEHYGLDWLHVREPEEMKPEERPTVLYGVNAFPHKLIIGPDGIIRHIVSGENPEFFQELDRLMKTGKE